MSIKGISKEIFVKKDSVIILTFLGKEKYIKYEDLKRIEYYFGKMFISGYIIFVKKTNEEERVDFKKKSNEDVLKLIELIKSNFSHINFWEISKEYATGKNNFKPQNSEFKEAGQTSPVAQYVQSKLYEASELADIVNSTTDKIIFDKSLNKIITILNDLQKYEDIINFETPPSQQLKTIIDNKEKTYNLLQERINNKSAKKLQQTVQKVNTDLYLKSNLDPLFVEAGRFIIDKDKASIGMLQRHFNFGFNRAARIIDQLAEYGVVGEEAGTKPRKILMTSEQFEHLVANYNGKSSYYESETRSIISESDLVQQRIKLYNDKFDYMEGHDFEYYCAELLKANGFINVEVTQASSDQGIDIIAFKDGIKYGIQCKCYSSDIGNKAVQEAFSGKTFYNCHVGAVLTNRYFTASAKELAEKNGVLLWDRDYLEKLIETSPS